MEDSKTAFSLGRLLILLLPVAGIALAVNYSVVPNMERAAQTEMESNMLSRLLGNTIKPPSDTIEFADADGDLVCDFPADDACLSPEKLVFSYIASPELDDEPAVWADVMRKIGEETSLVVEYQHYETTNEQLSAMARGELHVAGFNTGAAPGAVKFAGFVPVSTLGKEDGTFGYTMKLITPADSKIASPSSLRDARVAFTRPDSNSGFKAALTLLLSDHNLQPERDYEWGFTFDHKTSIRDVSAGKQDAAAVASDILAGMVNNEEVAEDSFRVIYESERFPPAVLGYSYKLAPEIREKVASVLTDFAWEGTSVQEKFAPQGVSKFVPVTYKDDWANIRRIDEAVTSARSATPAY